MSSLPGGAADKLGNRYESWWTLMRVADVLDGRATCIRVEPPGGDGSGAEFWVEEPRGRWYEQVKNVQVTWTINRLINEGVLPRLLNHLAAGHHIRLVLSTSAKDLYEISKRANSAETYTEFADDFLTKELRKEFDRLRESWSLPEATAWEYLRRVHVEHYPPDALRRLVYATYERLVQGDPEIVVNELRGWLDDVLHKTLTAPLIWSHFDGKGFTRRLLVGDPRTQDALASTVERYFRRVNGVLPTIGRVKQPYVNQLVNRLSATQGPQVVVLHGKAGSGKSTIAASAVRELTSRGWFAAAVRMDAADQVAQTAATLGRAFDLSASPSILLAGVAAGSAAVLLVDQLDAVSEYSGRMPDSYDAVVELLDQVRGLANVKVILAVRTVDLNADPRMRALLSNQSRVDVLEIGDLGLEDVQAALQSAGIDTTRLPQSTTSLLRVPLHFAVFGRLSPSAQKMSYRSLPELYEKFTGELRRDVERKIGQLEWGRITGVLVRHMSECECLYAPSGILDEASRLEIAALVSRGVFIEDSGRLSFFHETYFDYLFASAFVAAGRDLHDFLVQSGQNLFRRAQVRQILEYLAADPDHGALHSTIVRLLMSQSIRTHLQDVVITVLEQLNAEPDDWRVVEPIAVGNHKLGWRLVGLLSVPEWFDAADDAGRLESLLANSATVESVASQLVIAARKRPERVAALVRPYVGSSESWRLRLRALVEWSLQPGLIDLALELIERGDLDDARGPIAVNSDFWSILYGLRVEAPAGAARLIGAYLDRGLKRAKGSGSDDPFKSGQLSRYSSAGGASTIYDVASAAPDAFIDEVLPFVVGLAEATASPPVPGELRRGRWAFRAVGRPHGVDDAVFKGVEEALRRLAHGEPREAVARARQLAAGDVDDLWFLACRTLAATGAGNEAIDWLLSDDRSLSLGWLESGRWASRELIEAATRGCDDTHLHALTTRLLEHYPPGERASRDRWRRMWGRAQYELLSAVEPARRSNEVIRRLAELDRRFTDTKLAPPRALDVGTPRPPIAESRAEFLRDEDWIRAINKYRHDKIDWSSNPPVGGAGELAGLLAHRAEAEPERFAHLALALDVNTPPVHLERMIEAVAGKVPIGLFSEMCAHARRVAGQGVDRAICRAVEKVAADANETLLDLVEICARDDDPNKDMTRTIDRSGPHDEEALLTAGLNCTRGLAAQAIARLLFAAPQHADRLAATVVALSTDHVLAVRICAADAVCALIKARPEAAQDIAADLFTAPVDVFDAGATCRLLRLTLLRDPGRFTPHLLRALEGPEFVAKRAGRVWAVAFLRDALVGSTPRDVTELSPAARRGAAEVFAVTPADVLQELIDLFDDRDAEVRDAAASVMRLVGDADPTSAEALVSSFTASEAFADHFNEVLHGLDHNTQLLPEAAIHACERAVEISGKDLGDIRTHRAAMSEQLIGILLRLYRQGSECIRSRVLDLIDKLCETGAYGVREALAQQR